MFLEQIEAFHNGNFAEDQQVKVKIKSKRFLWFEFTCFSVLHAMLPKNSTSGKFNFTGIHISL